MSGSGMAVLDGLGHHMLAALLLGPDVGGKVNTPVFF